MGAVGTGFPPNPLTYFPRELSRVQRRPLDHMVVHDIRQLLSEILLRSEVSDPETKVAENLLKRFVRVGENRATEGRVPFYQSRDFQGSDKCAVLLRGSGGEITEAARVVWGWGVPW